MLDTILNIITSPYLYTALMGVLCGLYVVWQVARQNYLDVRKLFNVLTLALVSAALASFVVHGITHQIWAAPIKPENLWVHPRSLVVLSAHLAIGIVATFYLRRIRYPYWRVMDMLTLGLATVNLWLIIGWAIADFHWGSILALAAFGLQLGLLIGLYRRLQRPGVLIAVHIATLFIITAGIRYMVTSWQLSMTGVEWGLEGFGILFGIILIIIRMSTKSEKVILQDIPRGVSQGFRDTFARAFKHRQLSTKQDSSSSN